MSQYGEGPVYDWMEVALTKVLEVPIGYVTQTKCFNFKNYIKVLHHSTSKMELEVSWE